MGTESRVADALVVGGGVVGGAVALRLADAGLDVTLLAGPTDSAGQASRAAGAMLGVFSEVSADDRPARRDLDVGERLAARRLYDGWVADLADRSGVGVGIAPGLFVVANSEGEDDERALLAIAEAAASSGCAADSVSWRDVPGLQPEARARPFGVLHLPDEASVDTALLLDALDVVLAGHPMTDVVHDRAASLEPAADDEIVVLLESGAQRRARQVVLAAGADTTRLLLASERLEPGLPPILSGRGVSMVVRAPFALPAAIRTPNRGFACGTHLVPRAGGAYIGATNRLSTMAPTARSARLDELSTLLGAAVVELNTELRHAELGAITVGNRPVTLDGLPLAGRTADPRLLVASATYRNGILLAPRLAEILAAEVLEPGSQSGHAFSPRRKLDIPPDGGWLSATAGRSLVAQLTTHGGRLAAGRSRELDQFVQLALVALTDDHGVDDGLRRKLSRLIERAPLEEVVPLVFETVSRHRGVGAG